MIRVQVQATRSDNSRSSLALHEGHVCSPGVRLIVTASSNRRRKFQMLLVTHDGRLSWLKTDANGCGQT